MTTKIEITPIQGQSFSESFEAEGLPIVVAVQPTFQLTEADFQVLKADVTARSNIVLNLAASFVIIVVTLAVRWVYGLARKETPGVGEIDFITVGILAFVTLALWAINRWFPDRRSKVITSISDYFEKNKPIFGAGRTHGRSGR